MARTAKKEKALTPEEKLTQALVPDVERPYRVPENWCWVKWGNVGEFVAGSGFKNEYQGFTEYEIPFYKVGSLKNSDTHGFIYDNSNTINEEIRLKLKANIIPPYSVLFAKIGEAIKLNRRSINEIACCIDNNMMAFIPKCLMRYAFYWTCGVDLYEYANATTVPAIRKSDLEMIPFPLAPLAEQQRIVDRIESLFAKLDEAKEKAQVVVDGFEDRKAAILHKAFTGELTAEWADQEGLAPERWKSKRFDEIAEVSMLSVKVSRLGKWLLTEANMHFIRIGSTTRHPLWQAKIKSGAAMMTAPPQNSLAIDQFHIHHLLRSRTDVIHCPDPGHLIGSLKLFRDAFGTGHLID